MTFNVGESISRPMCVCVSTPILELTMSWIKNSRRSFDVASFGGKSFPDFEVLDARIASALSRIISTSKYNRFLRGRPIAYMKNDHIQATGACDAARGLSDLFSICLQNVDVQNFGARCDHISLGTSETPQ